MLAINSISLHKNFQPDFEVLKYKGWKHPIGFEGEDLKSSLTKDFKAFQFQMVKHEFRQKVSGVVTDVATYTEIFLHHMLDTNKVQLKGYGEYLTLEQVIEALQWLEEELE